MSELSPQKQAHNPTVEREVERQKEMLSRGVVDLLPEVEFEQKLRDSITNKRELRVKQGFDPTSTDIHLGHTVGLRKLRQFQDCGHLVVLIVGDYTAMVGDPSGRSALRPQLDHAEVLRNAETYQQQFFRVVSRDRTEVRFNGEWFAKMEFKDVLQLASRYTIARLLERDDFTKRFEAGVPIAVHELLYPLMQAYDSVAIKSDIELGGTDQKFNLLAGRVIQEAYGVTPQCVMTVPILVGLDGEKKMSKSIGNYIGITESPKEIFGKAMSIPDRLIEQYSELVADFTMEELTRVRQELARPDINPMLIKKELGERLVDLYHEKGAGKEAREEFERIFSRKELPDEIETLSSADLKRIEIEPTKIFLANFLTKAGLTKSNSEARKLIESGAVTMNGIRVSDPNHTFALVEETTLKVGKRRFLRLIV